jgi:hypothetical protein
MTKKDIKSAINKKVYQYAEQLGYSLFDDGEGGRVTFMKMGAKVDDGIEYHKSYHDCCTYNWANDEVKFDAELLNTYANCQKMLYNI